MQAINYDLHVEKREIQRKLFPLIKKKRVVALAGPNMISYLSMLPEHVQEVEIWENDPDVMLVQLSDIGKVKDRHIIYRYGDILAAEVRSDTFYDLDFCKSIKSTYPYLYRFRNCAFMFTCSNRDSSQALTRKLFLQAVEDPHATIIPHNQFDLVKSTKGDYLYSTYKDRTAMTIIFKFH